MSSRAAGLLLLVAVAAGLLAWWLAAGSEPVPQEPKAVEGSVPRGPPPGIELLDDPTVPPPRPFRQPPPRGETLQPPPGAMTAPPPGALTGPVALAPASGEAPRFPLDAGVRFPLSAQGIKAAVQDAKPDLQQCYEEWTKLSPSLQGHLKIGFRISDGGVVDRVRLVEDAGMGNTAFEGCVLSVMSDLRFDPPESGDLEVTYPIAFSTDGGG